MKNNHNQKETAIETRKAKVSMGSPGGNASKASSYYRVGIPPIWAKQMGITSENRNILLRFDGKSILIEKADPED